MKETIKGNVFIDLDETLVSSIYCSSEKRRNDYIANYILLDSCSFVLAEDSGWYVSFLRPIALQLINFCENLVGEDNVYILTASVEDYAKAINKGLGLGFKENQIYSREHIHYSSATGDYVPKFKGANNILIDNLQYRDHCQLMFGGSKVRFLDGLPREKYIQVNQFEVDYYYDLGENDHLEELKTKIGVNSFFKTNHIEHGAFLGKNHVSFDDTTIHNQTVNVHVREFKQLVNDRLKGVSTKYLSNYAKWYEFIHSVKVMVEHKEKLAFNIVDNICTTVVTDNHKIGLEGYRSSELSFVNFLTVNGRTNYGSCVDRYNKVA
jgi:hypothetical protein